MLFDPVTFFVRGGPGLAAESEGWIGLEQENGPFYVSHEADEQILNCLERLARENKTFVMVIVGVPGVGKTLFLRYLLDGTLERVGLPRHLIKPFRYIRDVFEFRDARDIRATTENSKRRRRVWVTLNLDEFVSVTAKSSVVLRDLRSNLGKTPVQDSVIISGNIGVLGNCNDQDEESIKDICRIKSKSPRFEFIRFPEDRNLLWIKQFGIIAPREIGAFPSATGPQTFAEYMRRLVRLVIDALGSPHDESHQNLVAYLRLLDTCLSRYDFAVRLHDIMQLLWLRHPDLYLTPRALNQFFGVALQRLVSLARVSSKPSEDVLAQVLYESSLPSIYQAADYGLEETELHRFRDLRLEKKIAKQRLSQLNSYEGRLRLRLSEYFSRQESRRMLGGGILDEFMDDEKLLDIVADFIDSIALMRIHKDLLFRKDAVVQLNPDWDFEKILLAPKIRIFSQEEESKPRRTMDFLIFDDRYEGIRIARPPVRLDRETSAGYAYLAKREKIIRLNLQFDGRPVPLAETPSLRMTLDDFRHLKDIHSATGTPDLSLSQSTSLRLNTFLAEIDGLVNVRVKPRIGEIIRERIDSNRLQGLMVLSLEDTTEPPKLDIKGRSLLITFRDTRFTLGE